MAPAYLGPANRHESDIECSRSCPRLEIGPGRNEIYDHGIPLRSRNIEQDKIFVVQLFCLLEIHLGDQVFIAAAAYLEVNMRRTHPVGIGGIGAGDDRLE